MLRKLIESAKKMNRSPGQVDPSRFDDPIAERTRWTPVKGGGANFCTYKLVEMGPNRIEFRAAFGAKLFYSLFLLAGVGVIVGICYKFVFGTEQFNVKLLIPMGVGLLFTVIGGCLLYFGTIPIVFDKQSGHYWKGKRDPGKVFDKDSIKNRKQLGQIHALQLISEYCVSKKHSYYSYELNLVLPDGERINVVDHGKLDMIREDAKRLSDFLGKPVWDGI